MATNNVIATDVEKMRENGGKARLTAYLQGMKKLERKVQIQKEAEAKRGEKA